jgi:hypothetical protein
MIWHKLKQKNIIITAPRRFGKTSLLFAMRDEPKAGYECIHLDLEKAYSPIDFVAQFTSAMESTDELEKQQIELEIRTKTLDWQSKAEELFDKIETKPYLFLLDEFSFMLDNFFEKGLDKKEIIRFLSWFTNKIRNKSYRVLITSSIDIDVYIEDKELGQDYFNEFEKIKLSPFDKDTSRLFTLALLYNQQVYPDKEVIDEIINRITPAIPFFLQIFTSEVITHYLRYKAIKPEDIEDIYNNHLLGPDCRRYMDDFYNHILRHYGHIRTERAKVLLDELCKFPDGLKIDKLKNVYIAKTNQTKDFDILLKYLEYDFYLVKKEDSYLISSPILREYWRRYQSRGN